MNKFQVPIICIVTVASIFFSGCLNQRREYYRKPVSDCFSDNDCPPGSKCMNNTCISVYSERDTRSKSTKTPIDFRGYYAVYSLPNNETNLVLILRHGREKPMFRSIIAVIASELRKYKNINVVSEEDITTFMKIQAQKMVRGADEYAESEIDEILKQYNTTIYTEVGINMIDDDIDVTLKLIDFANKQVISSARKTYFSKTNLDSNIDLLIRELLSTQ